MDYIYSLITQGTAFTLSCPSGNFTIDADETRQAVEDSLGNVTCTDAGIDDSAAVILIFGDGEVCITIGFAK